MTAPILTLAEVQALSGFTEGPWVHDPGVCEDSFHGRAPSVDTVDGDPVALVFRRDETTNGALLAAAPALHATCLHLHAEVARLTAERERLLAWLSKIEGGDNPSGGVEDLRQWAWKAGMGSEVDDG